MAADLTTGSIVGGYRLEGRIGDKSVQGMVWKAKDVFTNESVAVKLLRNPTKKNIRRFKQEA